MVDVADVGVEHRASAPDAPHQCGHPIQDRNRERHERQQQGDRGSALAVLEQRGCGDRQPEEVAPGVAHEDASGREVVAQEPERGADQQRREEHDVEVGVRSPHPPQRDRCDQHGAGGQPVEPVDEVDRVHHDQNPRYCERDADRAR